MSGVTWQETLIVAKSDGPTLTAAAAATCLPTHALFTMPANSFQPGKMLRVFAAGRISCVVTTPGTARFDIRAGGTVIWDSGALGLNVVAKTNVPWWLDVVLTCRAEGSGTSCNFMGQGVFQSEAVVGSPLPSAGSNGSLLCPVGAPAVGGGINSTVTQLMDMFFTQTVATGSMTLHQYKLAFLN